MKSALERISRNDLLGGMQLQANTAEVVQPRKNAKKITVLRSERRLKVIVIMFSIILLKREAPKAFLLD
jgi:hypothetical protein